MPKFMLPTEYARSRAKRGLPGGDPSTVRQAIRTGRISTVDGMIDPAVADAEWTRNTQKRVDYHGGQTEEGTPEWSESKAREAAAKADIAEIEAARLKGDMVDRAGVEKAAIAVSKSLQNALVDVLPAKLAPELAGISDPWALETRLRAEMRDTLAAIVAGWAQEPAGAE
jgi:hypothetical protein